MSILTLSEFTLGIVTKHVYYIQVCSWPTWPRSMMFVTLSWMTCTKSPPVPCLPWTLWWTPPLSTPYWPTSSWWAGNARIQILSDYFFLIFIRCSRWGDGPVGCCFPGWSSTSWTSCSLQPSQSSSASILLPSSPQVMSTTHYLGNDGMTNRTMKCNFWRYTVEYL